MHKIRGLSEAGKWNRAGRLPLAARLILGAVFIYASIDKVLYPAAFAEVIHNYRILPGLLIHPMAVTLPWVELLIGLCLVLGVWVPGGSLLSTLLLSIFFGAILFNTARGLNVDCGCFSTGGEGSEAGPMIWYLVRDGIFLGLAVYLLMHALKRKNGSLPPSRMRGDTAIASENREGRENDQNLS